MNMVYPTDTSHCALCERRVHRAQSRREKLSQLLLGISDAAERRAHHRADAFAILVFELDA